jgi:CHAT domain-containing protein
MRPFTRPAVLILAIVVIGSAMLVGVHRMWPPSPPSEPAALKALVKAVGVDRRIEPRLAGGFAYGHLRHSARRGEDSSTASIDLRLAAAHIEKEFTVHRTTQNLHYLGIAHLVTGDIDKSVAALEDASREVANDPSLMSDLAAAYLVRGSTAGRREDLAKAASQAEKATLASPSLAEAFFNRGLAFEALSLERAARETWERYLQLDGGSAWADEARRRLRALSDRPAAPWESAVAALRNSDRCRDDAVVAALNASPVRARDYFEDELLPSWGDAYASGKREEATSRLRCARALAEALARDGDLMALDAFSAIQAASLSSARKNALTLAAAHQVFRDGRRLFDESRFKEAEARFHDASRQLRQAGSGFELEATYFAARSVYRQERIDDALASLARLISAATPRRYLYLVARLHRLKGVIEEGQSSFAAVLEDYRAALSHYDQTHDAENAAGVHTLLAHHLQTLGEPRESWEHLFQALASYSLVSSALQRYQILLVAIQKCIHDDLPDVALHFQNAFLENARAWSSGAATGAMANAYLQRARVLRRLGDLKSGEQDVNEARRLLVEVRDRDLAERWNIEILLTEAENWHNTRPADAVRALTEAIGRLQRTGSTLKLPYLFVLLGRARLAYGDINEAQADFQRGIDAFEEQHRGVDSPQSRVSHFDESWDVFADMIRLQLQQRKRPDVALAYVERGRARTLLELVTRRGALPIRAHDISALQRRIPRNVAVLSFAVLRDELAAWVITDRSADVVQQQTIDLRALEARVTALRAAVTGGSGRRDKELLADLYDLLIRPAIARIDPSAALVVVPDGPLNSVPFAALIDRRTDHYLIEDRAIGLAPSLAVFVEMSDRLRGRAAESTPKLLVVGDPSINRSAYPNLANLEGAKAEALEIAALYRGAELLTGPTATKAQFLQSIRRSDVVHFAGHAIANSEFPWLSRLLFAPGSEAGSDTLFSRELTDEQLDQLNLVVLAACSTGTGAGVRGEGVLSLARTFLAAGAPTVVASLWDVSDAASQRLFSSFYRRLRSGAPPLAALRDAQLVALQSANAADRLPANWAGFAAIGGFSWNP